MKFLYSLTAHPSFLVKPKDQRVGMNGIATFECQASGNPPPSVFWTKEGSQDLMFAGTTHGQMFVSEDGTLTIQVRTVRKKKSVPIWGTVILAVLARAKTV